MPVNSFDSYVMAWKPERSKLSYPLYLSIANWLEQDILSGKLAPHTKLPPQRELADYLDVDLSTITRAYKQCTLKGVVYAATGRGTFVAPRANTPVSIISAQAFSGIEMGIIQPFYVLNNIVVKHAHAILKHSDVATLFEYSNPLCSNTLKDAAQLWFGLYHDGFIPEHISVASGGQNAIAVVLTALFNPGDCIGVDSYTYPNFSEVAKLLHIQLIPIQGDGHGILPEGISEACARHAIRGLYLMPTCSNPTGIFMPAERRQAIAGCAKRYGLYIIEDEAYPFLAKEKTTPLTMIAPKNSVYIGSLSKALSAGLRVAFIAYSDCFSSQIERSIYSLNLKTSSLTAEIAAEIIRSGEAKKLIEAKLKLSSERANVWNKIFSDGSETGFFRWLTLPEGYQTIDGYAFEEYAKSRGIHVYHSNRFAVGVEKTKALRIALSSPNTLKDLYQGLLTLKNILSTPMTVGRGFMV